MADLDELMRLPGALAAFEFTDKGELTAHKAADDSGIDATTLDMLSHACVANMSIATMQARGWESITGMTGFYPINGFTLIGVDWSAIVNGQTGVVITNKGGDYQAAYDALAG